MRASHVWKGSVLGAQRPLLWSKMNSLSPVSLVRLSGICPDSLFDLSHSLWRLVRLPNSNGISPDSLL